MKKKLLCLMAILLLSVMPDQVTAAEFKGGLGIGIEDTSFQIYVPMSLDKIVIEPNFVWFERDSDENSPTTINESNFMRFELGLGLFHRVAVTTDTFFYYGGRMGYIEEESKFGFGSTFSSVSDEKLDGYFIAPTIGFEYFLASNVSLGANVAWHYAKLEGSNVTNLSPGGVTKEEITEREKDTRTSAILRFYF